MTLAIQPVLKLTLDRLGVHTLMGLGYFLQEKVQYGVETGELLTNRTWARLKLIDTLCVGTQCVIQF